MADKSQFVDTISEATRQRRVMTRVVEPAVKEKSHLSHWPPHRWEEWRTEKLRPWKLKPWETEG